METLYNTYSLLAGILSKLTTYDVIHNIITKNGVDKVSHFWMFEKVAMVGNKAAVLKVSTDPRFVKGEATIETLRETFGIALFNENDRSKATLQRQAFHLIHKVNSGKEFRTQIDVLVTRHLSLMDEFANGKPFDMLPVIANFAFDFMLTVVYGKSLYALDGEILEKEVQFKKDIDDLLEATGIALHKKPVPAHLRPAASKCKAYIKDFLGDNYKEIDADLLRGLAIAGYATITAVLSSTLSFLGTEKYKGYQERTCKEQSLKMAENAMWESGRLQPPVSIFEKVASEDVELNGTTIRTGQKVIVSLLTASLNTDITGDPEEWDPTRWEANTQLHKYLFGDGPRACPGRRIAVEVLRQATLGIISQYKIVLVKPRTKKLDSMICEFTDLVVALERR
eukprot:TRINITY_DN139_c6_g1_i1.p1 TRINITY_DN139_c6_g1~~TRINITY_DN139_c6_g1_i1.p1  ORF type:complete len:412 (+),score=48.79 TRINITY_DN139_c6_g1_i1:49-1236(+)